MENKFILIGNCIIAVDEITSIERTVVGLTPGICINIYLKTKTSFSVSGPGIDEDYFDKIVKRLCTY